jgi:predicted permease
MNPLAKFDTVLWDVRYALRQIARARAFTAVAVSLLALGIGANVALFTVIHAVQFRPAPGLDDVDDAVRIIPIHVSSRGRRPLAGGYGSYPEFLGYREQREVFSEVATWVDERAPVRVGTSSGSGNSGNSARVIFASSDYFTVLRLRMVRGGGFPRGGDAGADASPVAVASHHFWRRDLDGAADVVGRRIMLNGVAFTIVGVTAEQFNGVDFNDDPVDLFIPITLYPVVFPQAPHKLTDEDETSFSYVARLRPGVSRDRANAVAATVAARLGGLRRPSAEARIAPSVAQRLSGPRGAGGGEAYSAETSPVRATRPVGEAETNTMFAVMGTIGLFILLITCTNVSNMLVGRAMGRRHEMGVRLSLGAGRGRIVRQLLTESIVLALLATIFAMVLLHWILQTIAYFTGAFLPDLSPSWETIVFAASVAIGTGMLFGLAPALHASKAPVSEVLKSGTGGGLDRKRSRLQGSFVVAQLALSIPALSIAAIAVGFVVASATRSKGYDESDRVLTVTLQLPVARYGGPQADALATQVRQRVAAMPGVTHVALGSALPGGGGWQAGWMIGPDGSRVRGGGFVRPDDPSVLAGNQFRPAFLRVDPDFFEITKIPIRRGRGIQKTDVRGASYVIVVSEDYARHVWPNENPIGRTLVRGRTVDTMYTVVGIAGTVRNFDRDVPTVYGARAQRSDTALDSRSMVPEGDDYVQAYQTVMLVRTTNAATGLVPAIRAAILEVDRGFVIPTARTLAARRATQIDNMMEVVYAALGAAAVLLTLSSVGIYAIIAFGVAQRTREIGVRIALGARSFQVVLLFVREGLVLTAVGLFIGLPISIAAIRFIPNLGTLDSNPYAFAGTAVVLMIVAAFAAWLPARRAARVDPVKALRAE